MILQRCPVMPLRLRPRRHAGAGGGLRGQMRRWLHETRAAVTVEFVIAVPLLLAVLAFTVQYGYAMQVRNALDVAVRDAARYLSRAPIDPVTGVIHQVFLDRAAALVNERIADTATVEVEDIVVTGDFAAIRATASVELPLLSVFVFLTGSDDPARITMIACEGWVISETRVPGDLVTALAGSDFSDCADGAIAAGLSG